MTAVYALYCTFFTFITERRRTGVLTPHMLEVRVALYILQFRNAIQLTNPTSIQSNPIQIDIHRFLIFNFILISFQIYCIINVHIKSKKKSNFQYSSLLK